MRNLQKTLRILRIVVDNIFESQKIDGKPKFV